MNIARSADWNLAESPLRAPVHRFGCIKVWERAAAILPSSNFKFVLTSLNSSCYCV